MACFNHVEEGGFTSRMWRRPQLLRARTWELREALDADSKIETPKEVARALVGYVSSHQGETRAGFASLMAKMDLEPSKDVMLIGDTRHSDEFKREVRRELDEAGWTELYRKLRAEHEAAAGSSEDVTDDSRKARTNISQDAEGHGSRTARACVFLRAVGHACGFGPDAVARLIPDTVSSAALKAFSDEFRRSGYMPGCGPRTLEKLKEEPWNVMLDSVLYIHTRTCFLDDATLQFVELFPKCNVVLLGAGFDMRFHRLSLPASAMLWEVDTVASQRAKRLCVDHLLASRAIPAAPSVVRYVPCNFEEQGWFDVLIEAGMSVDLPAIVLWEGVCQYLPRNAVLSTFRQLALGFPAVPAAIAFDYMPPQLLEVHRERTSASDEPWRFAIEPGELEAFVRSASTELKLLDHLTQEECANRYMPRRSDGTSCGVAAPSKFLAMVGNSSDQWNLA